MNVATLPTTPIRVEHGDLRPQIDALAHTAAWMRDAPAPVVREKVTHAVEFLQHHVLPHAAAEEETLYEAVEGATQAPGSTRTMQRDHVEIARMTEALALVRDELEDTPSEQHRDRITQLLYGVHAILTLHLAKEEEIYLPILDEHLTPADAAVLFDQMRDAEGRHHPTSA